MICYIRMKRSYTHTHINIKFYCVICHNTRNLYHIRVIDSIQ